MNQRVRSTLRSLKAAAGLVAAVSIFAGGCAGYHLGGLMHPQVRNIAVGQFENTLDEPGLGARFRDMLVAALLTDGSVHVTTPDRADAVIEGRIVQYKFSESARAKVRSEKERSTDRDAYQTTVFKAKVVVAYTLRVPGRTRPLLDERRVVGIAEFPAMPDMRKAHTTGLEAALRDAAVRTAASVTEAW